MRWEGHYRHAGNLSSHGTHTGDSMMVIGVEGEGGGGDTPWGRGVPPPLY